MFRRKFRNCSTPTVFISNTPMSPTTTTKQAVQRASAGNTDRCVLLMIARAKRLVSSGTNGSKICTPWD